MQNVKIIKQWMSTVKHQWKSAFDLDNIKNHENPRRDRYGNSR